MNHISAGPPAEDPHSRRPEPSAWVRSLPPRARDPGRRGADDSLPGTPPCTGGASPGWCALPRGRRRAASAGARIPREAPCPRVNPPGGSGLEQLAAARRVLSRASRWSSHFLARSEPRSFPPQIPSPPPPPPPSASLPSGGPSPPLEAKAVDSWQPEAPLRGPVGSCSPGWESGPPPPEIAGWEPRVAPS